MRWNPSPRSLLPLKWFNSACFWGTILLSSFKSFSLQISVPKAFALSTLAVLAASLSATSDRVKPPTNSLPRTQQKRDFR